MGLIDRLLGNTSAQQIKKIQPLVKKINALEDGIKKLSDAELRHKTVEFRERLAKGETLDQLLPEAFAVVREAAVRTIGQRHYDVQLIGGIVLHQGRIAEMKTGEGKTLVSTLAGYLNAIAGKGVHVVTVNDYLAKRDSEWMGRIYKYLGMTVGLLQNNMPLELKRPAYQADVTYGTNSEFGFDYLRDNMVTRPEQRVQRGHNYAIVDEVDSILIDEARTPLIISGAGTKSASTYKDFARAVRGLERGEDVSHDMLTATEDVEPTGDYVMDEAKHTIAATERGLKKIERRLGIDDIYADLSGQLVNHLQQALKAQYMFHRDKQYVVTNGEVKIVDEFTGRIMEGRRYSEGLHQAIEAKEGVTVARENRTLATITFQNYFRMYDKLAGMTGTAMTEEQEFRDIYRLDVVELPTNKPLARVDLPDAVYKTQKGKYAAILDIIAECYSRRQPILVGTTSIEKSEMISKLLKARGVPHEVLNAKFHEKEAEIVAQAGKPGAVTISTNMAGRGTDIMLGGNAEYLAKDALRREGMEEDLIYEATAYGETQDETILAARRHFQELLQKYKAEIAPEAEKVRSVGGLYILGTERHESRRIDNQLRGRAGRQGDPGTTKFVISLEDDLMRLFGGERLQALMNSMGVDENMPIEAKLLSNSIQSAQARIEGMHFEMRKNVLKYDDVMNRQREIIYSQRRRVLDGESVSDSIRKMMQEYITASVQQYLVDEKNHEEWNLDGLRDRFMGWITDENDLRYSLEELRGMSRDDIAQTLLEKAEARYEAQRQLFGESFEEIERVVLLRNVDTLWMDHIDAMEELKRGIGLRGYAQQDPVVAYRLEGFEMFDQMIEGIKENTVKMLLTIRPRPQVEIKREQTLKPLATGEDGTVKKIPMKADKKKPGRNDPCPCGSGLKYKKCCGKYPPHTPKDTPAGVSFLPRPTGSPV